jgi:hypothetical protein
VSSATSRRYDVCRFQLCHPSPIQDDTNGRRRLQVLYSYIIQHVRIQHVYIQSVQQVAEPSRASTADSSTAPVPSTPYGYLSLLSKERGTEQGLCNNKRSRGIQG